MSRGLRISEKEAARLGALHPKMAAAMGVQEYQIPPLTKKIVDDCLRNYARLLRERERLQFNFVHAILIIMAFMVGLSFGVMFVH